MIDVVVDDDFGTGLGKFNGGGLADATGGTGDEDDFVFEIHMLLVCAFYWKLRGSERSCAFAVDGSNGDFCEMVAIHSGQLANKKLCQVMSQVIAGTDSAAGVGFFLPFRGARVSELHHLRFADLTSDLLTLRTEDLRTIVMATRKAGLIAAELKDQNSEPVFNLAFRDDIRHEDFIRSCDFD